MAGEKAKKNKGGRPPKYKAEYAKQVEKICRLGATNEDIADFFGVCINTIDNWRSNHAGFLGAIKRGKDYFDTVKVEGALKFRAVGYQHEEEKVFCNDGRITTHNVIKHYPPDTTAAIFWLKNRDPERWRDKQEIDHTTKGDKMQVVQLQDLRGKKQDDKQES